MNQNEFIVYKTDNNDHYSAGFDINSILLNRGLTPFSSHFRQQENDESSSDEEEQDYEHLAVPFGLYVKPYESREDECCDQECQGAIPEEVHNTFIALVEVSEPVVIKKRNSKKKTPQKLSKKNKSKKAY